MYLFIIAERCESKQEIRNLSFVELEYACDVVQETSDNIELIRHIVQCVFFQF